MSHFRIINYSNNCYLNVIIQVFLCNKETSNFIAHHLDFMNENGNKIISPKKLMLLLSKKMSVGRQNDSQEAFTQILDLIPELEKLYINKIKNTYTCLKCNKKREVIEQFTTFYMHKDSIENSIRDMIGDEKFELECEHCKINTDTIKSCRIHTLANVLVFFNVLKNKINYTENITYSNRKYKLKGIVKHFGCQRFGHYVYVNYPDKIIINDLQINKCDKIDTSDTKDIYLLVYSI